MNFSNFEYTMWVRVIVIFSIMVFYGQILVAENRSVTISQGNSLYITAQSFRVKKADFNQEEILIFQGHVKFGNKNNSVTFSGDKMMIGFKKEQQFNYFQMLGNVRMERGRVHVTSEEAYSSNLKMYVDFFGDVTFSTNGSPITVNKIRYSFVTETFSVPDKK